MSLRVKINKKLRDFRLDIDFESDAKIIGILGESGSGKSMTLKSLAGLTNIDSGFLSLNGRVLYDSDKKIDLKPQERNVGYLFQSYALFPNMTVKENIMVGLKNNPKLQAKDYKHELNSLLSRFDIVELKDSYPEKISGGQRQRVALARLLAYEPEMILLDEPFSALDASLKEKLRIDMKKFLREYQGIAILVSHQRDEIYELCDEVLAMKDGRILRQAPKETFFLEPDYREVAKLTGCKNIAQASILDGKIHLKNYELVLDNTEKRNLDSIKSIGIRANYIIPLTERQALEKIKNKELNIFKVKAKEIVELPFIYSIILENNLWIKIKKDEHFFIPEYIQIPMDKVLYLKD